MVEMISVGEKIPKNGGPIMEDKDGLHFPSMLLNAKQVPKLEGMKPGDKISLLVDAEIVMQSARKEKDTFDLEIKRIGISKKSAQENEDEETEEEANEKGRGQVKERLQRGNKK